MMGGEDTVVLKPGVGEHEWVFGIRIERGGHSGVL